MNDWSGSDDWNGWDRWDRWDDPKDWDEPRLPFLWDITTADPQLLSAADSAHAHAVERWEVSGFDRTVLDLYRTRMDAWHARHLWAVTAPVRELAADGDRVAVPDTDGWDVPASGLRALRACGLPASLFESSGFPATRPDGEFHVLTGDRGDTAFRVERGSGRVTTFQEDPEPLASSLVAFVELAWRRHHLCRAIDEEDVDSGWVGREDERAEADFADLVRWIDPESCFREMFPLIDDV